MIRVAVSLLSQGDLVCCCRRDTTFLAGNYDCKTHHEIPWTILLSSRVTIQWTGLG